MNYELAKKLKEKGFPQKLGTSWICQHEHDNPKGHKVTEDCDKCYLPTLSELIDACGFNFYALSKRYYEKLTYLWYAETSYGIEKEPEIGTGKTPEEAVAHLYLAIKAIELSNA